jgi:PIN domain nuclease of toxin-antitoxin system
VRILLDTNALLWFILGDPQQIIGPAALQHIHSAEKIYTSPITIVEIHIKTMLGKLRVKESFIEDIYKSGIEIAAFNISNAEAIKLFPELTRHDPFDRMLVAQACAESLTLLTSDKTLLNLKRSYIKDVRK